MYEFFDLIFFAGLVVIFYITGTIIEKAHYYNIKEREQADITLAVVTSKKIEDINNIYDAQMVSGSVVISLDYFKRILAGLRNIVGGRVLSYESLLDRGRREAVLRMKNQAKSICADMIINMRFQTSSIGTVTKKKGSIGCFEVLAYGTAVKFRTK